MILSFSERRQAEAARIREKYPDRIPVLKQSYLVVAAILLLSGFSVSSIWISHSFGSSLLGHCGEG
jgi:hypothetical protein